MSRDTQPGRRERQILRRRDNPLFPPQRRAVTSTEVAAARAADAAEAEAFAKALADLLERTGRLAGHVDSEVILSLKEEADQLYEQCRGLGGDHRAEEQGLTRLLEVLMEAVRRGAGNDPQARDELDQEETARAMHQQLLREPLIADLLHPESPVLADELVPTLLSAGPEAFTAALQVFGPERVPEILDSAARLLEGLPPDAPQRRRGEQALAQARIHAATFQ